jgi:hypothetical protein
MGRFFGVSSVEYTKKQTNNRPNKDDDVDDGDAGKRVAMVSG